MDRDLANKKEFHEPCTAVQESAISTCSQNARSSIDQCYYACQGPYRKASPLVVSEPDQDQEIQEEK
nr:hypothetical protein [Candidatus Sigynarchaeum springense]